MIKQIEKTMCEQGMIGFKSVLIGLSGGADSVALTNAMLRLSKKYNFTVYAAHVNHCIRKDTAVRDEMFSKDFAEKMGIKFFSLTANVKEYAKKKNMSEELAGREVRYNFFDKLCDENDIDVIATAHHMNDNAETIIMNFMRGSGIAGLSGIPYKRGNIIRPLLDVSRRDIEKYCDDNNLDYVTDETNLEQEYTRNKIRHTLIPEIEKIFNPNIVETVTSNAAVMKIDSDYMSYETDRAYKKYVKNNSIDIKDFQSLHNAIQSRLIFKIIDGLCGRADISGITVSSVSALARKNKTGSRCDIARGISAWIDYGILRFGEYIEGTDGFNYALGVGQSKHIPEMGITIKMEKADRIEDDGAEYFSVEDACNAQIVIRSRRQGDKFMPAGMGGTKKIKDFMIDEKIPKTKRNSVGILTINGDVAWVVGYRRDKRFKFEKSGIKIWISY